MREAIFLDKPEMSGLNPSKTRRAGLNFSAPLDPEVTPRAAEAFRTQLGRVCVAAGVPVFSPHDLRHRRISLLLRSGVDPVSVSRHVGHARASMSLDVYGHVLIDDEELDYAELLGSTTASVVDRTVLSSVLSSAAEMAV